MIQHWSSKLYCSIVHVYSVYGIVPRQCKNTKMQFLWSLIAENKTASLTSKHHSERGQLFFVGLVAGNSTLPLLSFVPGVLVHLKSQFLHIWKFNDTMKVKAFLSVWHIVEGCYIYNTICKIDSQWEFVVWLRELKQGLWLKGGMRREVGRREHGCTYGWFFFFFNLF